MNEIERVERLAARARLEPPPRVDVADGVMAALRHRTWEPAAAPGVAALAWVAGLSAAVAIPMLFAALAAWEGWVHPLLGALLDLPLGMGLQ